MSDYPIYLNLRDKKVLLVGGGAVGRQKISGLLEAGARLQLVSPTIHADIEPAVQNGSLAWERRSYQTSDLEGAVLVIAATDDEPLQRRIAEESRARSLWVCRADHGAESDFTVPAGFRRGDLQVAISTGGCAPAVSKRVRQQLESAVGEEWGVLTRLAKAARAVVLQWPLAQRTAFWDKVASDEFIEIIRRDGEERAGAQLKEWMYGNNSF